MVVAQGAPEHWSFLPDRGGNERHQQSSCTPTTLYVVTVSPGDNFAIERGLPVAIEAFVLDDCWQPSCGHCIGKFSNGDDPILLTRNSRGGYSDVWTPVRTRNANRAVEGRGGR
ncbi:MAG: hypothetical protein R2724_21845 [Bryobacterales bacterium]